MSDCPYCTMLRCADDTVDLEKWKDHAARWHRLAMDYQAEIERLTRECSERTAAAREIQLRWKSQHPQSLYLVEWAQKWPWLKEEE